MGEKIENGTIQIGEIIGKTLDGKDIYKFTELGMAKNVEIIAPQYKDGDFVVNEGGSVLIFKKKVGDSIYDHAYFSEIVGEVIISDDPSGCEIKRYANEEEKQKMLNALAKKRKRWNEEKLCVEDIPSYKKGDFLVKEYKDGAQYIFILDYIDDRGLIYYHCYFGNRFNTTCFKDDFGIGSIGDAYHKCLRYATDSEKELLISKLYKVGKRWNEEKKCVEDIPKRKFNAGDKVVLKSGYKKSDVLIYLDVFDLFIGKPLTIRGYTDTGYVLFSDCPYIFSEDWFEPYVEELKKGDLAIFWNGVKKYATIRIYDRSNGSAEDLLHKDTQGLNWSNAIKFESKEQYERFINGEL